MKLLQNNSKRLGDGEIHGISERKFTPIPKGYHLDVVGGPSTPHDPEIDAGGSLSSWQGHPSP
jgi:hypothetical protein